MRARQRHYKYYNVIIIYSFVPRKHILNNIYFDIKIRITTIIYSKLKFYINDYIMYTVDVKDTVKM